MKSHGVCGWVEVRVPPTNESSKFVGDYGNNILMQYGSRLITSTQIQSEGDL